MNEILRIGTRGSALAMRQTEEVRAQVARKWPDLQIEICVISTKGDRVTDRPLPLVGGKGLFTEELESAMLSGEIDIAVHSLKDLPTEMAEELSLHAICERVCPYDAFVSKDGTPLSKLKPELVIGTSSLRRRAQLLRVRPDVTVIDLRGNLDTRLKKVDAEGPPDGAILASAGLLRMGWDDRIAEVLDGDVMLPAPGQGAVAVQGRSDDSETQETLRPLDCLNTRAAVTAERAFLHGLGGGCHVPIGCLARVEHDTLLVDGGVFSVDGHQGIRKTFTGDPSEASTVGQALAEQLLAEGAAEILKLCEQETTEYRSE